MISFNNLEPGFSIPETTASVSWLKSVASHEGKKIGDLSYVFCSDDYLLDINKKFLSHDTFTDIITFPQGVSDEVVSGEIFISLERIKENAVELSVAFDRELLRVMVHGLLHLLGYEDGTPGQKSIMRSKEDYYLNLHP